MICEAMKTFDSIKYYLRLNLHFLLLLGQVVLFSNYFVLLSRSLHATNLIQLHLNWGMRGRLDTATKAPYQH